MVSPPPGRRAPTLTVSVREGSYAVSRLPADAPVPLWSEEGRLTSVIRTPGELTVICADDAVPPGVSSEKGFAWLEVDGPMPFSMTGVVVSLARPLAAAGISVFVLSSYDTDHLLIRRPDLRAAVDALVAAGHRLTGT